MEMLRPILGSPWLFAALAGQSLLAVLILIRDMRTVNAGTPGLMKWVWGFTVAYLGLFGLAVYWTTGRPKISDDADWRRGARSTAHCYSGCGAGEIAGVIIAVGVLSLSNLYVAAITFALAYTAGIVLTVGPMMQEGVGFGTALRDAIYAETASIVVMEAVAIGADLYLAQGAHMGDIRFWTALIVSLTLGYLAAWPINIALIKMGVKGGMGDPREHASA